MVDNAQRKQQKKMLSECATQKTNEGSQKFVIGQIPDKVAMCQVKYVICLDINEQVNPGSKIWLPNVRSILKPYCIQGGFASGRVEMGTTSAEYASHSNLEFKIGVVKFFLTLLYFCMFVCLLCMC